MFPPRNERLMDKSAALQHLAFVRLVFENRGFSRFHARLFIQQARLLILRRLGFFSLKHHFLQLFNWLKRALKKRGRR